MKGTVQKTLTGETASRQTAAVQPISITDMIWLPVRYLISTANLQRLLFLLAFLTYGVGDGITAAYMMDNTGVMREINPVVRFVHASYGAQGVVSIKIWFAFVVLFLVWIISRKTNTYWTINGFLSALCVGGVMAIRANLMAAYGMTPPSASSIIMTFLTLTVLFVMLGDLMDKFHSTTRVNQPGVSQASPSF
jgi:hypothetical protein